MINTKMLTISIIIQKCYTKNRNIGVKKDVKNNNNQGRNDSKNAYNNTRFYAKISNNNVKNNVENK